MGEVNHVVDTLRLEYKGLFDTREMFRMFTRWMKEKPYEKGGDYASEQHTSHGKCIEYYYFPWFKLTETVRKIMKIRLLVYDLKKVDVMVDGKKKRMDHARVIIYIDGLLEYDYEYRWQHQPLLIFFRTLYIKWIYNRYTKIYERIMIDDCHELYELFERFFNMYKTYKPIKGVPHFYY